MGLFDRVLTEDSQDQSVEIVRKFGLDQGVYNTEWHQIEPNATEAAKPIDVKMTQKRMYRIMRRRQEALLRARELKMDYIWVRFSPLTENALATYPEALGHSYISVNHEI